MFQISFYGLYSSSSSSQLTNPVHLVMHSNVVRSGTCCTLYDTLIFIFETFNIFQMLKPRLDTDMVQQLQALQISNVNLWNWFHGLWLITCLSPKNGFRFRNNKAKIASTPVFLVLHVALCCSCSIPVWSSFSLKAFHTGEWWKFTSDRESDTNDRMKQKRQTIYKLNALENSPKYYN